MPSLFAGAEEASTNVELKAADASANPYLALGGLIAAGLDGIERGLEPPEPVQVDPATIDEAEREARGIRRLPATQAKALDALESDGVLMAALGPVLAQSYLAVRRSEWRAYSAGGRGIRAAGSLLEVLRRRRRSSTSTRTGCCACARRSTSSAASSPRAPTRGSGRTSRPPSPTGARSASWRRSSAASRPRRPCSQRRLDADFDEYAAGCCARRTPRRCYLDDGFPAGGTTLDELAAIAGCEARPVCGSRASASGRRRARPWPRARADGFVALKTIAAYRTGLHHIDRYVLDALDENERTGAPLPVQVHCGFGDSDLSLPHADPAG